MAEKGNERFCPNQTHRSEKKGNFPLATCSNLVSFSGKVKMQVRREKIHAEQFCITPEAALHPEDGRQCSLECVTLCSHITYLHTQWEEEQWVTLWLQRALR